MTPKPRGRSTPLSFSNKILAGLASGVLVGIVFGEYAGLFRPVADGFVRLLQMTVLPYVTISIIQLGPHRAPSSPWLKGSTRA